MNFKISIAAIVVSASLLSQAFAYNGKSENVSATKVATRFNLEHNGTSAIWSTQGNYYQVFFVWHNELMQSYYTKAGQLVGTYYHIDANKLPAVALRTIRGAYSGYQLTDASIVERPGQDSGYFATLTGKGKTVKLEINPAGDVYEL